MKINKDVLKELRPCTDRYENYLTHYKEFDGEFEDFIDLPKISYSDKVWVAKNVLNKNQLVHWAILCAQSVLEIYENKYPDDKRIRNCLDYLSTKDFNNISSEEREGILEHRHAAYAAADAADAVADVAYAAVSAAVSAADTDAAYASAYAAYSADAVYAAYAYAAADAADAAAAVSAASYDSADVADAAYSVAAMEKQQTNNLTLLKMASTL